METRLQSGTLYSGIGHAGVLLWVLLGDWLFAPEPPQEIISTQVSMISEAEFAAMQSSAPSGAAEAPEQPSEIAAPEPVQPERYRLGSMVLTVADTFRGLGRDITLAGIARSVANDSVSSETELAEQLAKLGDAITVE